MNASDIRVGQDLPPLEVDVTPRLVIMGASASRDWQPQHHDHAWAVEKVGTAGVFLNTPNIAGWIERYLTDFTGPEGRLARLSFRMRRSICAGDRMTLRGRVANAEEDGGPVRFLTVGVEISVEEDVAVECDARIAVPSTAAEPEDRPWRRAGERWRP